MPNSNYNLIPGLDLWNKERNAYDYSGTNPVIAHPPCQQWSKLKKFAKEDPEEKGLGPFLIDIVKRNGGVLEHPLGSDLFRYCGVNTGLYKVDQNWFGFPARKVTLLFVVGFKLLPYPIMKFVHKGVSDLHSSQRSKMTLEFCQYLVNNVKQIDQ